MAVIGMITGEPSPGPDFNIAVRVSYFDDADPNNEGYANGHLPRAILRQETHFYATSLTGTSFQNALKADVKAMSASLQPVVTTAAAVKPLAPVGALITASS